MVDKGCMKNRREELHLYDPDADLHTEQELFCPPVEDGDASSLRGEAIGAGLQEKGRFLAGYAVSLEHGPPFAVHPPRSHGPTQFKLLRNYNRAKGSKTCVRS